MLKLFSSRRALASITGVSALALGLAGCGGGGSSNRNSSINNSLPDVPVALLTSSNRITVVSARRPGVRQTVAITGLRAGEQLIGIDFRYPNAQPNPANATNSLFGLGNLNGS